MKFNKLWVINQMAKVFRYDFKKITAYEKFVLLAICEFTNKKTYQANVHPTQLAEYCSLSVSTIYRALKMLKDKNLITLFSREIRPGVREHFIEIHKEEMFKYFSTSIVDNHATEFANSENVVPISK